MEFPMRPNTLRPILLAAALTSATAFAPVSASSFDKVEVTTEQELATFEKVYIAPVDITLADDEPRLLSDRRRTSYVRSQPPVDEEEQTRKAQDLHKQLTRRFSSEFTLVEAPADDVLTISAEITRMLPSRPTGSQRSRGVGALNFGGSVAAGGVDYTVQMSSGETPLYNITESYRSNLNDGLPRTDVWQDADRSFNRFSRQLLRFVQNN
jgi:hypothetical protein